MKFGDRFESTTPKMSPRPNFPSIGAGTNFEFHNSRESNKDQAKSGFSFKRHSVQRTDRTQNKTSYMGRRKTIFDQTNQTDRMRIITKKDELAQQLTSVEHFMDKQ